MYITPRRMAALVVLVACVAGTARLAARPDRNRGSEEAVADSQYEPHQPSAAAIADSQAVAATHRSRTLAALFEEFRTTTPQNARINSRAISNLFFDGNPLMRLVSSGDFAPIQASSTPLSKFEADAIASFKAGGPGYFARLDRVGPCSLDNRSRRDGFRSGQGRTADHS